MHGADSWHASVGTRSSSQENAAFFFIFMCKMKHGICCVCGRKDSILLGPS